MNDWGKTRHGKWVKTTLVDSDIETPRGSNQLYLNNTDSHILCETLNFKLIILTRPNSLQ